MSITIAPAPPNAEEVVREGVAKMISMGGETREDLTPSSGVFGSITMAAPHPVYHAGLADIIDASLVVNAQLSSWRYLVLDGQRLLGAAELKPAGEGETEFAGLSLGKFVQSTVEGITAAEDHEAVRDSDYEFRLLKIPSLFLVAVWLHGSNDFFVPLAPTPRRLVSNSVLSGDELIAALQQQARDKSERDEDLFPPE